MAELSDSCEELYKLFGKPEDGDTGCYLSGPGKNMIINKDGEGTGYFIGGALNSLLINPEGEIIANFTGKIPPSFTTRKSNKETGYFVQGAGVKKIVYDGSRTQ